MRGGKGLTDLEKYHWACHLIKLVDWNIHVHRKAWVTLENAFNTIPLHLTPWLTLPHVPSDYGDNPLIGATLSCFHKTYAKFSVSSSLGPLTPINHNLAFPPDWNPIF